MNYKAYIKERVKNLHEADQRIKARQVVSDEIVQPMLETLVRQCAKGKITPEKFTELCADITMAFDHGSEWFIDEIVRREEDAERENELYGKLSIEEINESDAIDIKRETQKMIDDGELFE